MPIKQFLTQRWRMLSVALTMLVIGISILVYLGSASTSLAIEPDYATEIVTNEPFNITLNIQNTSGSEKSLISIGIEQAFLAQGIQVESTVPRYRDIAEGQRWTEYRLASSFLPPLAPNEELPLRLTLIAAEAGTYRTTLTVWVENETRPHYVDLEFEVGEE